LPHSSHVNEVDTFVDYSSDFSPWSLLLLMLIVKSILYIIVYRKILRLRETTTIKFV
jgi:hypothetical protein